MENGIFDIASEECLTSGFVSDNSTLEQIPLEQLCTIQEQLDTEQLKYINNEIDCLQQTNKALKSLNLALMEHNKRLLYSLQDLQNKNYTEKKDASTQTEKNNVFEMKEMYDNDSIFSKNQLVHEAYQTLVNSNLKKRKLEEKTVPKHSENNQKEFSHINLEHPQVANLPQKQIDAEGNGSLHQEILCNLQNLQALYASIVLQCSKEQRRIRNENY
jgi:hypothetical protein